ncbi:hypothetical protein TanjilG_15692 [Lupinus angustifolius]|uniref:Uncharacterized protein n=1 Tax=Lupinus angustifolius TaxID=3871 RepID=A0A1J7GN23_LUPAN|nr:PREDICTED: uncharacterized protein LOC109360802 [Lupinus angustifolius]OIW01828.1 hypothetical protein TanjilG_15692 [Lupinus angustifolius]
MGLISYAFAGIGFILVGAHEALNTTLFNTNHSSSSSSFFFIFLSIFSSSFVLNSLISLFDANNSNDAVGSAFQLQILAVALIFLFYSVIALLNKHLHLPTALLGLICNFAFVEEFLLFYLQRKDTGGIENRYYDLLLAPLGICIFSNFLELKSSKSNAPRLGRGIGLILQGTWFIQMGLSLFSKNWVAEGCSLHQVSRGNYSLRCNGHPEYHRARAIATLQFNCHLSLMVVVVVALYPLICGKDGGYVDSSKYRPIGAELQSIQNSANFTLDSDGDGDVDDDDHEIKEGHNVADQKAIIVELGLNGHVSHP